MCGISALSSKKEISNKKQNLFFNIHEKIKHRGPDATSFSLDEVNNIYLGHHRLSIIDIEGSNQPFKFQDIELVFNGEIYNYLELREELINLGYEFQTSGDTEVLIKAFHKWRNNVFDKIDGMFCCIFKEKNKLTVSTDFFGEKPLYLYQDNFDIYLCSEALPIIENLDLKFNPDINDLYYFLGNGFMDFNYQGFENLIRLKPGFIYEIIEGQIIKKYNYYERKLFLNSSQEINSNNVLDILRESTKKRIRSDVNIGVFLSSGTDSVLTACLLKECLGSNFICLTSSTGADDEEYHYAKNICKYLNLEHKKISFEDSIKTIDAPRKLIDLYTVPNDNLSGLAVANLSSASNKHIKVAFVGTGADEIFVGYNKYKEISSKSILLNNSYLEKFEYVFSKFNLKYFPKTLQIALRNKNQKFLSFKNLFLSDMLIQNKIENKYLIRGMDGQDLLTSFRRFDLDYSLPLSYNESIDRGTMRFGIEARSIFLNKELFNLTNNVKTKILLKNHPKPILRNLLNLYLPKNIISQKKRGFSIELSNFYETFKNKKPIIPQLEKEINFTWDNLKDLNSHKLALRLLVLGETYARFS